MPFSLYGFPGQPQSGGGIQFSLKEPDAERGQAVFGVMAWRTSHYRCSYSSCICSLLLLARGEMVCQIEHVSSDSDAGKPCTNGAVAESADCGIAIVPIVECGVADNRSTNLIPVWRKPYRTSTVCFGRTRLASQFVPSLSAASLFQPTLVWCRGAQ